MGGDGIVYDVPAGAGYVAPGTFHVEGDASSASYFLAAGALGGGPVRVRGRGPSSVQGDVHFVKVLEAMGAKIEMGEDWIECARPAAARGLRPRHERDPRRGDDRGGPRALHRGRAVHAAPHRAAGA